MSNTPLGPLSFEPFLRPMPWGGQALAQFFDKQFPKDTPIGEAWLLSDHSLHHSRVADGPLAGCTLRELMEKHGQDLLGYSATRFPLLIKLLDAKELLSVQVHQDDADAARWAPNEGGKTEAWLVLEANPGAAIYLGLKPGVDKAAFERSLSSGTAVSCLQRYEPKSGQCYLVPAGTVHALGGGVVVLEVQQTSDATYRLYDWDRTDAQGKPRPLHREAGLACMKEHTPAAGLQRPKVVSAHEQELVACDYFKIFRMEARKDIPFHGPCILVGIEGQVQVVSASGATFLRRGRAVLVPASLADCIIQPSRECVVLRIDLPAAQ